MSAPTGPAGEVATAPPVPSTLAGIPSGTSILARISDLLRTPWGYIHITGPVGSGKSALLVAAAANARQAGLRVLTDLPRGDVEAGTALVIDDIHLRDASTLQRVAELATLMPVVTAAEPRDHHRELRAVCDAARRNGFLATLSPLTTAQVIERSRSVLPAGAVLPTSLASAIRRNSGGIVAAVDAALAALSGGDGDPTELATQAIIGYQHRVLRSLDLAVLDVLALAAARAGTDPDTLAATLRCDRAQVVEALDAARGSGFLSESDLFLAPAVPVLTGILGTQRCQVLRATALEMRLTRGMLSEAEALAAAQAGVVDPRLADQLTTAAGSAPPARAVLLLRAALAAGAEPASTRLALADAAAMAGELDCAAELADGYLSDDCAAELLPDAVRIAAAVSAVRGHHSHCAGLYRWLGPQRANGDTASAVLALLAVGDHACAQRFCETATQSAPTSSRNRDLLLGQGLMASMIGSGAAALGPLLRSAAGTNGFRAEPESAAVVAALLCIHTGDLAAAGVFIDRHDDLNRPDRVRLDLLGAWVSMAEGDVVGAATILYDTVAVTPRDRVLALALALALARRRGDIGALAAIWRDGVALVTECEVHLFGLLALGEIWMAAIRLGNAERVAHHVQAAENLLDALGRPPAWSSTWHWYAMQAAIAAGEPEAFTVPARLLADAAATDPYAAALATAGKVWLTILQSQPGSATIEADSVETASRQLEKIGMGWDAGRLASEAALRAVDTGTATTLLQTARTVTTADRESRGVLTGREAEVARELLRGLTYREIGERLFISAKTVEHHVARIRRRLGAGSRSELLSMLRAAGYDN